jgi:hypothetical protein
MVPYQAGLGIQAARSRDPEGLERTALRDPRFGVGYVPFEHSSAGLRHLVRVRADLTLPLGDTESFTRDASPSVAPGATLVSQIGRVSFGFDASARIRRSVTLGDVRHGSQLVTHLGVAFSALDDELLGVSAETSWFWSLASETKSARKTNLRLLPGEWLVGISSRPNETHLVGQYGGGGLPVSAKHLDLGGGQSEREAFVGLGAPDVRLMLLFVQESP